MKLHLKEIIIKCTKIEARIAPESFLVLVENCGSCGFG